MSKKIRECELYPPVRDWLAQRGWEVHVEKWDCDIVAVKGDVLRAVELKPALNEKLVRQLHDRARWADEVMGAVAAEPRGYQSKASGLRYSGFGLLQVDITTGKVRQRIKPRPQPWHFHSRRTYRMRILADRHPAMPHEMAGIPASAQLREQNKLRRKIAASGEGE